MNQPEIQELQWDNEQLKGVQENNGQLLMYPSETTLPESIADAVNRLNKGEMF